MNKSEIWKAQIQGLQTTLAKTGAEHKTKSITSHIAESFNRIVAQIAEAHPELADALPRSIGATRQKQTFGLADATYLDLEAYCEQVVNLLTLVE